jgi:hypothetical protein
VTHHPSRKQFFAKLFGAAAALGVFPKLFAKSAARVTTPNEPVLSSANGRAPEAMFLKVRPDTRAVARRGDSI